MSIHVFLSGHGGWTPARGYTQVPKGCKLHFYTDFAKNLITGMEYKILDGSWTHINRTIDEFKSCPNMRLSPQDAAWTRKSRLTLEGRHDENCLLVVAPPGGFCLSDVFRHWTETGVEFHWLACQTLGLNQVGGRNFGLNAGDFAHDPTMPGRFRVKKADNIIEWIKG